MLRSRRVLLGLIAIVVAFLGLVIIVALNLGSSQTPARLLQSRAGTPTGEASPSWVPSPTEDALPNTVVLASPTQDPTPSTATQPFQTEFPPSAVVEPPTETPTTTPRPPPWALSGNKYGIHLLLDDDRGHWLPAIWPEHVRAARQIVGEGGYVIQLVRLDDLDVQRWQFFLDLCAQEHLIPIIRLATTFDHENRWWEAPPNDATGQGYSEVALRVREFLVQLSWPSELRYVIVHNEANRGDEWSNQPSPAEYARFLLDVGQTLRAAGFAILGPALDLYAPHTNGQLIAGYRYIDAETFLDEMALAQPGVFEVIDVWASHAYPLDPFRLDPSRQEFRIDYAFGATNPRHLPPPEGMTNRGVNSYRWELWKLEQFIGPRAANLPVLITETGWRHGPSQDSEARDHVHAEIPFELQSAYIDLAFHGNGGRYPTLPESGWTPWSQDQQVLAAVLFALGGFPKDWGHTNWVEVDRQGRITGLYPISLPK